MPLTALRGLVGPYAERSDGKGKHTPREHYRLCRRIFKMSRRKALVMTWMAYYTNWTEANRP